MNWFRNLKIGTKILGAFMVVCAITAIVGYMGITKMRQINELADEMYQKELMGISYIKQADVDLLDIGRAEKNLLLSSTSDERQKYKTRIEEYKEKVNDNVGKARELIYTEKGKAALAKLDSALKERYEVLQKIVDTASNEDLQKSRASVELSMGVGREKSDAVEDQMNELSNIKAEDAKDEAKLTTDIYESSRNFLLILVVSGVLLGMALGLLIARIISKPIQEVAARAEKLRGLCITNLTKANEAMARGELDVKVVTGTEPLEINSKDEIGVLAGSINGIIKQTQDSVAAFEQALGTLRKVVGETKMLIQAAQDGKLSERGKADQYQGGFREMVQGVNGLMDAVTAPINEAAAVLEKVSQRDLTVRIKGDYKGDFAKIKDSLNTAVQNLEEALTQVAMGSEEVASAAGQISSGSQTLAQGASEQASSIEQIGSSLQETASMTKSNAANAKEARSLSDGARGSTEKGVNSMKKLSEAINKIKASADATAKIVKTIDDIAFQTNLLALNAAVEAARAGDAGKGFAVVAEEVRNLAMRSAEAAKNTANLIEESVNNAEGGVAINEEVLRNLDEINQQVKKVSEVVSEIAAASDQQSHGVEQINTGIDQMNTVTQQMAANSEESASAAEELSSQAEEMQSMVGTFRLSQTSNAVKRTAPRLQQAPAKTPSAKQPERATAAKVAVPQQKAATKPNGKP